jgi:uncharacterized membrane-anchored protein YitT (DUF2179 family)
MSLSFGTGIICYYRNNSSWGFPIENIWFYFEAILSSLLYFTGANHGALLTFLQYNRKLELQKSPKIETALSA